MARVELVYSALRVERAGAVYGTSFAVELEEDGVRTVAALTCLHVIERAGIARDGVVTLAAMTPGSPTYRARIHSTDEGADLALLVFETPPAGLAPLTLARDDRSDGHDFFSFGFPHTAGGEAHGGHWGYGRIVGPVDRGRRLQLRDCDAITAGFSGAPVFDPSTRRVAGVLSAIAIADEHLRGRSTAFAVPASVIRKALPSLATRLDRPFRGLDPFTEADRAYWIDPSDVTDRVLAKLDGGARLAAVIGPSGVGKSSLLHAGLVPELRERAASDWDARVEFVRLDRERVERAARQVPRAEEAPTARVALEALARAWSLGADGSDRGLVLVLDQFEEVLLAAEDDCRALARALTAIVTDGAPGARIVLALREHFLGVFGERAPELKRCVVDASLSVPLALPVSTLRRIIDEPAQRAGRPWDANGFSESLLTAVRGRYAAESRESVRCTVLPVLQVFLAQQWDRREAGGKLVSDFEAAFEAALTELVASALRAVSDSPSERAALEPLVADILVRFVTFEIGAPSEAPKGRARRWSEIELAMDGRWDGEAVDRVLRALVEGRVLAARAVSDDEHEGKSETLLEVVHDAVLTGWAPLAGPIEAERRFLRWQGFLEERAQALRMLRMTHKRWILWRHAHLLDEHELDSAREWEGKREIDGAVRELVTESKRARTAKRWRSAVGIGVLALFVSALGLGFGYTYFEAAREREDSLRVQIETELRSRADMTRAQVRALGQEPLALVNAIQAAGSAELIESPAARREITAALARSLLAFRMRAPFDHGADAPFAVALTQDGARAVFRSNAVEGANVVEHFDLYDTHTGARLRRLASRRACFAGAPDGGAALEWDCAAELEDVDLMQTLLPRGALLDFGPDMLLLSNGSSRSSESSRGVRRVPLDPAAPALADLAPGHTIAAIDRSRDGAWVALGAVEDAVILVRHGSEAERVVAHPGPVVHVAVEGAAPAMLTLGPEDACFFRSPESGCVAAARTGWLGSVDLWSEERGAVSSFELGSFGVLSAATLAVVSAEGTIASSSDAVLELSASDDHETLRGFNVAERRGYEALFQSEALHDPSAPPAMSLQRSMEPLPLEGLSRFHLREDGGWETDATGMTSACADGRFGRSAVCGGVRVVRYVDRWLRIAEGTDDRAERIALAYDAATGVALVEVDRSALELVAVDASGRHRTLARVPCHGWGRDAPSASPGRFLYRCDGSLGLLEIANDAERLRWQPWLPPGVASHDVTTPPSSGGEVAVLRPGGVVDVVALETGDVRWSTGTLRTDHVLAFDRGILVVNDARARGRAVVLENGQRRGSFDRGNAGVAEVLSAEAGPLLWLAVLGRVVDTGGRAVELVGQPDASIPGAVDGDAGADGGSPPSFVIYDTSSDDVDVSPDGRWLAVVEQGFLTSVARIEGPPAALVDAWAPPDEERRYTRTTGPHRTAPRFAWLPGLGEARFFTVGMLGASVWTRAAGTWERSRVPGIPADAIVWRAVASSSGQRIALVLDLDSELTPHPQHLLAVLDTSDWQVAAVLERPAANDWGRGVIEFLDDEHILFGDGMSVVSLRTDDLRREACALLRGRSEYQQVRMICHQEEEAP